MASVGAGPQSNGKKSLDAEVNLVPFIDLLSMCICFLLMTAVWIQIAAVQVKQSHGTEASEAQGVFDLEVSLKTPTTLEIVVKKGAKPIKKFGFEAASSTLLAKKVDSELPSGLLSLVDKKPSQAEFSIGSLVSAAMVTSHPTVSYGDMVLVLDVLRKHQIVNLGVVPAGGT